MTTDDDAQQRRSYYERRREKRTALMSKIILAGGFTALRQECQALHDEFIRTNIPPSLQVKDGSFKISGSQMIGTGALAGWQSSASSSFKIMAALEPQAVEVRPCLAMFKDEGTINTQMPGRPAPSGMFYSFTDCQPGCDFEQDHRLLEMDGGKGSMPEIIAAVVDIQLTPPHFPHGLMIIVNIPKPNFIPVKADCEITQLADWIYEYNYEEQALGLNTVI